MTRIRSKRSRNSDSCKFCGDRAAVDPETFQTTGVCAACANPRVKGARKVARYAKRMDREAVVVRQRTHVCDVCGERAPRPGYRHDACADAVERGEDWNA